MVMVMGFRLSYFFFAFVFILILTMHLISKKINKNQVSKETEKKVGLIFFLIFISLGIISIYIFRKIENGYMIGVMYLILSILPLVFVFNKTARK